MVRPIMVRMMDSLLTMTATEIKVGRDYSVLPLMRTSIVRYPTGMAASLLLDSTAGTWMVRPIMVVMMDSLLTMTALAIRVGRD